MNPLAQGWTTADMTMHSPGPPFEKGWTRYPTAGRGVSERLPVVRVAIAAERHLA